ncbi:MAG TPA: very short patch repair endonuclease, partial [Caulobacteraceae bacterium]
SKPTRTHRGDIMSAEKRSVVMSRIRGRNTKPELAVEKMLLALGVVYESQVRDLPGRPDFVVREARVAVLVDGDFWHGWNFNAWHMKLSEKWDLKIAHTIRRDTRNRRALRRAGWVVVRLWEHQVKDCPARCKARIKRAISVGLRLAPMPGSLQETAEP